MSRRITHFHQFAPKRPNGRDGRSTRCRGVPFLPGSMPEPAEFCPNLPPASRANAGAERTQFGTMTRRAPTLMLTGASQGAVTR
jgi:hypothetical protein